METVQAPPIYEDIVQPLKKDVINNILIYMASRDACSVDKQDTIQTILLLFHIAKRDNNFRLYDYTLKLFQNVIIQTLKLETTDDKVKKRIIEVAWLFSEGQHREYLEADFLELYDLFNPFFKDDNKIEIKNDPEAGCLVTQFLLNQFICSPATFTRDNFLPELEFYVKRVVQDVFTGISQRSYYLLALYSKIKKVKIEGIAGLAKKLENILPENQLIVAGENSCEHLSTTMVSEGDITLLEEAALAGILYFNHDCNFQKTGRYDPLMITNMAKTRIDQSNYGLKGGLPGILPLL